jgi:predicted DNA-binding transcriptional regulator YafY
LARLPEAAELAVVEAARLTSQPDTHGWFRVTVPIDEPGQALADLFRLAPDIEILHPAELRATMVETVRTLSRLYESSHHD